MYENRNVEDIRYTGKQRKIVGLLVAAILLMMLLSSLFFIKEAGHECAGANCPVCAIIQKFEDSLRQLGLGYAEEVEASGAIMLGILILCIPFFPTCCMTLVSRKVRLND